MKKLLLHILILIALGGLLNSITDVHAQDPTGTCVTDKNTYINVTKASCDLVAKNTGEEVKSWTPNTTSQTTPTPAPTPTTPTPYQLLAPLPCDTDANPPIPGCTDEGLETFDPAGEGGGALGGYLNLMIKLFIGICAVLAVVMIVMGGIQYMTTELISSKEEGKKRIMNAIFGLLLALGAYTLLYTINPDLLNTDLKSLKNVTVEVTERQIAYRLGQGKCEPLASGICAPGNLTVAGFANGTQASSICNGESGGVSGLASGVDMCSDGNAFSFGLFQINILAHANEIPGGMCSGIFETKGSGIQGACLQQKNGICIKYDCSVKDSAKSKYQSCINYITNPTNNIKYAVGLQSRRGWGQWGVNASCRF